MPFPILAPEKTKWDCVSLGDVMLRLDPGETRIRTAREFKVWEGGGEYNVSRGLKKVFGLRTSHVLGFVDNEVGYLLLDLISQGGVDVSHSVWKPFDGIGHTSRIGLNFTERGFGVRGALGAVDRAHAASGQIQVGEINWEKIFSIEKTRWFHTGGIYIALSPSTPRVMLEAYANARKNGAIISYDMNFRPSLWKFSGNTDSAIERNREVISNVDVLFGGVDDFKLSLGMNLTGLKDNLPSLDGTNFEIALPQVLKEFPNLKLVATTLRTPKTATLNDWSALIWCDGKIYKGNQYKDLEILDRVGGGDGFASGVIYSLLNGIDLKEGINLGVACGALAMTTPGDSCTASLSEVLHLAAGGNARTER
jgi:2-dehydro-3-deoxygluconokinase